MTISINAIFMLHRLVYLLLLWHALGLVPTTFAFVRSMAEYPIPPNNSSMPVRVSGVALLSIAYLPNGDDNKMNNTAAEGTFLLTTYNFKAHTGKDNETFAINAQFPDTVLPLMGSTNGSICNSKPSFGVANYPCAVLGFFYSNANAMWMTILRSNDGDSPAKAQLTTTLRGVPFNCSADLPCTIRSPSASEGSEGGCSDDGGADTLAVVGWNSSWYIFKPLTYFNGIGRMHVVARDWPLHIAAATLYEVGLRFDTIINPYNISMCSMTISHANGTVEVYSVDDDDPTSPTGLGRVAIVSAMAQVEPLCIPTVQYVYSPLSGNVLSVTCINGMGWLWSMPDVIDLVPVLVGSFTLPQPETIATALEKGIATAPLIVDIAITMMQVSGCGYTLAVTTIALLGRSYNEPVSQLPLEDEDPSLTVLSLAVYGSDWYEYSINNVVTLTDFIYSSSEASPLQSSIYELRSGLGWVVPPSFPAEIIDFSSSYSECLDATVAVAYWFATNVFYVGMSSTYAMLINPSTGTWATASVMEVINNTQIIGGALFSSAPFIEVGEGNLTRRLPSPGGQTAVILQTFDDSHEPTIHFLASSGGATFSVFAFPQFNASPWAFQITVSGYYTPSPISLQYAIPIYSPTVQLYWPGNAPLFSTTSAVGSNNINNTLGNMRGSDATRAASLTLGASTSQVPNTYPTSLYYEPSTPFDSPVGYNADSTPEVLICHGQALYFFNTQYNLFYHVLNLSASVTCPSGHCVCAPTGIYAQPVETRDVNYAIVVYLDVGLGVPGAVLVNILSPEILSVYSPSLSLVATEAGICGPFAAFGDVLDVTRLLHPTKGFAIPMVGTRCFLMLYETATNGDFHWGVYVTIGQQLLFNGHGAVSTYTLVLSAQLTSGQPSDESSPVAFNISNLYTMYLLSPQEVLFGASPLFSVEGIFTFQIIDDLTVMVKRVNDAAFTFSAVDSFSGSPQWESSSTSISPDLWQYVSIFTVPGEASSTSACVAIGHVVCVAASSVYSGLVESPKNLSCYGPPAGTVNTSYIWVTEGYPVVSVSANFEFVVWRGVSPLTSSLVYPLNQTSCSDAVISNEGLILLCSIIGSTVGRLHIVDGKTGRLIYGYGPHVNAGSFSVAIDGSTIEYLDLTTGTFFMAAVQSVQAPPLIPYDMTVCGFYTGSPYLMAFSADGIQATMVPGNGLLPVIQRNYSQPPQMSLSYAFADMLSVSLDRLAYLPGYPDLLADLNDALYPPVLWVMTNAGVHVSIQGSSASLSDLDGQVIYMSSYECYDCYLDCPSTCTLNTVNGVQTYYLAQNTAIVASTKPMNSSNYDYHNTVSYPITYSGNPSINIYRFVDTLPDSEQQVHCNFDESRTTIAPSGRYCYRGEGNTWSVIDLLFGNRSTASNFLNTGKGTQVIGRPATYYSYTVWTDHPVYQVDNEVGLVRILSGYSRVLPLASMVGISNVIYDGAGGILVQTGSNMSVTYTQKACTNQEVPMCPQSYTVFSKFGMTDQSIQTITWKGHLGSNWGDGFVAVGYPVHVSQILRAVRPGLPVHCPFIQNTNPTCTAVCQPTSDCQSQLHASFLAALSLQSWLPSGSTFNSTNGPCNQVANMTDQHVMFYGAGQHEVIATITVNDVEVVILTSSAYQLEAVFGVGFQTSHCAYFEIENVISQPFSWLAICAVKSLVLTICFHLLERRLKERERKRAAAATTNHSGEADVTPPSKSRPMTLFGSFVHMIIAHCKFRSPTEVAIQERNLRANYLPKELTEGALAEHLRPILIREEEDNYKMLKDFAQFYELRLCYSGRWIVRADVSPTESSRVTACIEPRLLIVHDTLRRLYKEYAEASQRPFDLQSTNTGIELGSAKSTSKHLNSELHSPLLSDAITDGADVPLSERVEGLVELFSGYHESDPYCFEYATLSCRLAEEQLRPSAVLLSLALIQSLVTLLTYSIDVHDRGQHTITALQMYECVCFMVFNSSLPSTLLVSAVFYADLGTGRQKGLAFRAWCANILGCPFVIVALFLLSPPLVTHIIPGLLLYGWALLPPIAIAVLTEVLLRNSLRRHSRTQVVLRVCSRVAILYAVSVTFSIAFNASDSFLWKRSNAPHYPTGSYIHQGYFGALEQDIKSRSLDCVWEHLMATISNFLQVGFFFV